MQKALAGIDPGPLALQAKALPLRYLTVGSQIDATYTNNDGGRGRKLLRSYPVMTNHTTFQCGSFHPYFQRPVGRVV